jgi:D-galactarolactone cycloisomerase
MVTERIVSTDIIPLAHEIPPGAHYGSSRGLLSQRAATLVRMVTESGITGWGDASGPTDVMVPLVTEGCRAVLGESLSTARARLREFVAGQYHRSTSGLHVAAASAVDIAIHDAFGKLLDTPVSELLGGRSRETVAAYASTGFATESNDLGKLREEIDQAIDLGYDAVKLKLGFGLRADVERVRVTRESVGPHGDIMVDMNGNYTADVAIQVLRAVEAFDLHWVEEPVPPEDLDGLRSVRSAGVPVAGGEACYGRVGFRELISRRLLDVVQPDVSSCGGFGEARGIVEMASTWNVRVSPHVWGTGIGLAASLQLAAIVPRFPDVVVESVPLWVEADQSANDLREQVFERPLVPEKGKFVVPDGPGLGITVDEDAIARFAAGERASIHWGKDAVAT